MKSNNYKFRRHNAIEREKLIVNRIVAAALKPSSVLDAFAGDGTSTRIFAHSATQVFAIEKNPRTVDLLLGLRQTRKLTVIRGDNLSVMPFLAPRSFDLIDLDPYGNCNQQLEYAAQLRSENGVILVTSGEIQIAARGLRLPHLPASRHYVGRSAIFWAEEVWLPFLLKSLHNGNDGLQIIHFFTSPVLTRAVLGTARIANKLRILDTRDKYLGWFQALIANGQCDATPKRTLGDHEDTRVITQDC